MSKRGQYFRSSLAAAITVLLPIFAYSASAQPVAMTLSEAIANAIAHNPELQAARMEQEVADARITEAKSVLWPQIDLAESFNRTNSPLWAFGTKLNQKVITSADFDPQRLNDPDAINNFNTALSMTWPLYMGGQNHIGVSQARSRHEASSLAAKRSQQQVISHTAKAYVGLLLAGENLSVIDQSLATARAHLRLVQSRYKSGFVVKSDLLRAQVRIAELEQQRLEAQSRIQVGTAVLNAAMGQSEGISILPATPFKKCIATPAPVDDWIETALARRPDLAQLRLQESVARLEVDRARGGHLPNVALRGAYDINTEDFSDTADNYTVGAVVNINLFSGQGITSRTTAARAGLRKLQAMRQQLELGIQVQTRRAYYTAQSAWQRIQVARSAVDQAEEGLRIVGNRYQNGLLTIVSLLDAEVARQQARTLHFKALHDYKVARIDLALAAGAIDRDFK